MFLEVCVREKERHSPPLTPAPSPPPKRTLLVHLGVNREGVFIKPPFFTHYCNKGRSFVNWSKIIDMNWFFSFPGTKFGVFSLWDPSIFKTLTTASNTKIDKRKENVYSINMLSISCNLFTGEGDLHHPNWLKVVFSACGKAIDSVNVAWWWMNSCNNECWNLGRFFGLLFPGIIKT